jgi:hypothetical protein
MKKPLAILLYTVVALALMLLVFRNDIYASLDSMHMVPHQRGIVELYFEDFTDTKLSLPRFIQKGTPVEFSFTIRNVTGAEQIISYVVQVETDGSTVTIDRGSLDLQHDEARRVDMTYPFKLPHQKAKFIVSIPELDQSIHFFIPRQ